MKKLKILILGTLLFAAGCSEREPAVEPSAPAEPTATALFSLEADIETGTVVQPMTRATVCTQYMENRCRMLFLKREGQRWIVDSLRIVPVDPDKSVYAELLLTGDLPPCTFRFELRPGDYRVVAVLNGNVMELNRSLTPGTVVADEADPRPVPELFKYRISSHIDNDGFRMLNREVFVAVADFTIPKSGDLHQAPPVPVTLKAERRVCKVRFLLKDVTSPQGNHFIETPYKYTMTIRGLDGPLVGGIDAFGDSWYGGETLYELPWRLTSNGEWYPSDNGFNYLVCRSNATVFSPFLLVDPAVADFPAEFTIFSVTGQTGVTPFYCEKAYTLSLAASRITGLVFQPTDRFGEDGYGNPAIAIEAVVDERGVPENPAELFDDYFEWNRSEY